MAISSPANAARTMRAFGPSVALAFPSSAPGRSGCVQSHRQAIFFSTPAHGRTMHGSQSWARSLRSTPHGEDDEPLTVNRVVKMIASPWHEHPAHFTLESCEVHTALDRSFAQSVERCRELVVEELGSVDSI